MTALSWTHHWRVCLNDLARHAPETGSRLGPTKERVGCSIHLSSPLDRNFVLSDRRAPDPTYACGELIWFLSGNHTTIWMESYAPSYTKRYGEPDGSSFGGYGVRMRGTAGLDQIAAELELDKHSRRAILPFWRREDLIDGHRVKDVPCTLSLQFLLRGELLHMIVSTRSNDVWLGMPYDVWSFTCLQAIVAATLGVRPGDCHYNVGSLHLYERYYSAAQETIKEPFHLPFGHCWQSLVTTVEAHTLVTLESCARTGIWNHKDRERWAGLSAMGRDVLACAVRAYGLELPISSPLLNEATKIYADSRGSRPSRQDDAGEAAAADQPAQQ